MSAMTSASCSSGASLPPRMCAPMSGVRAHDRHLLVGQPRRFEEQRIGNADLADVVQRRGASDQRHFFTGEAERLRQAARQRADAFGMPAGARRRGIRRAVASRSSISTRVCSSSSRAPVNRFEQRAILFLDVLVEQPRLELVADPQASSR